MPLSIFSQTKMVGINTSVPSAQLDIVTQGNTESTKALEINNATPIEMVTLLNNGNMGINTPAPSSQLEVTALSNTKSALRLRTLTSTDLKQSASINYNSYRKLVADENGNVLVQYNPVLSHANSITFDGEYISNFPDPPKVLCAVNTGSIIRFTIHSSFSHGQPGVGAILYADITWSKDIGFLVSKLGSTVAAGVNPVTVNGEGTNTLTFNYQIGNDVIFEVTGGNLTYKSNSFRILKSFRSR